MNVLILNWRDPKNPKSGGAEKLNMQIIKPLLDRGDTVTWYSMSVKGLPKKEYYQGVSIIRFGNSLTHLLLWPFLYWWGRLGETDFIIDSIHGTGYLSSLVAPRKKKIILICEVAQNIWDEMYSFPVNKIGLMWEKIMFRFYQRNKFWTISDSTRNDLMQLGIQKEHIAVLPMGFDAIRMSKLPLKSKDPTALFVGRLAEMKGIKDAIRVISDVNKLAAKKWTLKIIGRGDKIYEQELKKLVEDLNITDYIKFFGYVSEKRKFGEMARSWVLLVPSSREGWGMIVPEANSVETAVIGYNVPGLKDSIKKYAKENVLVSKNYVELYNTVASIKAPIRVQNKPKPGWDQLDAFVYQQLLHQ